MNYGADVDVIPVRDSNNKKTMANDKDNFAQRVGQQRRTISQWSRDDLEDKHLRLYEESLLLKKHARKQEDKIKRMATKLLRLVSDKKKAEQGGTVKKTRDIETEEMLEELHGKIREVEKQNAMLKEKLMVSKQQAAMAGKRTTVYGHVQSRIDTGIQKAHPDPRISRNIRVSGPVHHHSHTHTQSARQTAVHSPVQPRYGHSLLEETRTENRHLEGMIDQLNEQINIYEQDIELLKEQMRVREAEYEEDLLKLKQQMSQGQRVAIQENIDIIKLQRDVKEKSTKLTAMQGQYGNLEEKLRAVRTSHDQVLNEMERINHQYKEEQTRVLHLENELKNGSANQRRIVELEERVTDYERECEILKEANEKLVSSAFDLEREREWRKKEGALKVQIAQLEATLKADVGEKGSILDRLTEERDTHDRLEEEHKQLRIDYFEMKQETDELKDKMKFFTKESAVDFQEIEEALMIVKQRKAKDDQQLDFLFKVDNEKVRDYEKLVAELQAEHADTINELEKTRNMLIVQHKINKDYQMEVDAVTRKMDENSTEYETKLQEYAQLLDIRAGRIRKLEGQLRDVAYGTRQYRAHPEEEDIGSDMEDLDETLRLDRGQNLVEIHVKRFTMSQDGLRALNDEEPSLFCTWEFYEYEIQSTPVMRSSSPEFRFTSQYVVTVDDFFLHYLQRDSATLELHLSMGTDFRTLGACQLSIKDVLEKAGGRLHGTAQIIGKDERDRSLTYGVLEYWVRLRVPMAQALRLYKERVKALGYVESNIRATEVALQAMDESATRRPKDNINELNIKIIQCQGVQARREGIQPSPYIVYKFFDYDDHDSTIVPGSNNPQYNDRRAFPTPMTTELDKYLKSRPLVLYCFDDTDPEETEYLGVAKVPLLPLAHNKGIHGIFELRRKDGSMNGTVEVNLKWAYTYMPPKSATRTPAQEQLLASVSQPDVKEHLPMLPGEEEQLQQSVMVAGSPGMVPPATPQARPPPPRGPTAASTPMPRTRNAKRGALPESPLARAQGPAVANSTPDVVVTPPHRRGSDEADESIASEGSHVTGESEPVSESSTPRDLGPEPVSALSLISPVDGRPMDARLRPVPIPRTTLSREFTPHDFGSLSSLNSSGNSTQSFRGTKGFLRRLYDRKLNVYSSSCMFMGISICM